jgi:acyl-CoA thioester hydrolase
MTDRPLYVHRSTIWFDELDMVGVLHNARYAIHVERAMTAWFKSLPDVDPSDALMVVKRYEIEFVAPFTQERGELAVELTLEHLGNTSVVWSFRCVSHAQDEGGPAGTGAHELVHAHGTRTNVKVSPGDLRPAPWSERVRRIVADATGPVTP